MLNTSEMERSRLDKETIREKAMSFGFDVVGFAPGDLPHRTRADLDAFISAGLHGDMTWMADTRERRRDPKTLWSEVQSVIVLGVNYSQEEDPLANLSQSGNATVSVYARNRDYHTVLKKKIKKLAQWLSDSCDTDVKVFVDTAPVMEKPLAERAGLGWQGKHTNIVSQTYGSWLFLGEIFTTLEITSDPPGSNRCGTCQKCLEACPTNAFLGEYEIDARRCISYLTIEHKGHIPTNLRPLMGNHIYGCDDCLAVCPWNKFASLTNEPSFLSREELKTPRLAELIALDDKTFRSMFSGSPIKRIGRDRFLRNVVIAVGNSGSEDFSQALVGLLRDRSALVRAAVVWSLSRILEPRKFKSLKNRWISAEADPDVKREWNLT